jgi:membrane-associated phospholipid phosphatase
MTGSTPTRTTLWAAVFALTACMALAIDVPVANWFRDGWGLGDVRKMLNLSEVFAHGFGVALILITIAVLDPWKRPLLLRVTACAFGAGAFAQLAKHLIPRIRPNAFNPPGDVFSSFVPWGVEAQYQAAELGRAAIQSFPSGHTATAAGLALGLAWLYPRGRWLFLFFACLSAAQRITSLAHFVSDALAAAALACLVAGCCLSERGLGQLFTRFERAYDRSADRYEVHCARLTIEIPPTDRHAA